MAFAILATPLYVACGRATDEGEGDAEETSEVDSTGDAAAGDLAAGDPALDLVGVDATDEWSPEVAEDLPADGGAADGDAAGDMDEPDTEADSEPWTPPHPTWEEVCGRRTWPEECACDRSELDHFACCVSDRVYECYDEWFEQPDGHCNEPEYAGAPACPPPPCSETAPFPCECDPEEPRTCCFVDEGVATVFECRDDILQWDSKEELGDRGRCDHPSWTQPLPACPQP